MPDTIFEELVRDVISQETTRHSAEPTDFKWATCTGAVSEEHAKHLASAQLRFAKHTEDAQVTLEKFNLLDPPSVTMPQSSESNIAIASSDGGDDFADSNEEKKVALLQQV
jgi:hypothetical protein